MPRAVEPEAILAELRRNADPDALAGMARFGIDAGQGLGVRIPVLRRLAGRLGNDHGLAVALWETGWRETRILASMVDEPERVTRAQMDAWVRAFKGWDLCDQCCMNLFRWTAHADAKAKQWAHSTRAYVRRAAFSLVATMAVGDKAVPDARFVAYLPLIAEAAGDDRPAVSKAVDWALRQIGKRNASLHAEALSLARRLARDPSAAAAMVGRVSTRELESDAVRRRLRRAGGKPSA